MLKQLLSSNVEFAIPALQVALYVLLIVGCLIFTKYRAGLLMSFLFTFYWVFILNREKIKTFTGGENSVFMGLYFVCGALVVGLSLWAFYMED